MSGANPGGAGGAAAGVQPAPLQTGSLPGQTAPVLQPVPGQATVSSSVSGAALPSGSPLPSGGAVGGAGNVAGGTALPGQQPAGASSQAQIGNQAGLQGRVQTNAPAVAGPGAQSPAQAGVAPPGRGAALAALTSGAGGLGLEPGAAPVRTVSGQPYQQLGSQLPGAATGANALQQGTAAKPGPAAQVAGALQKPLAEQQAGLTSLFAQIGSLMNAQGAGNVALPDSVVKAMQQILGLRLNIGGGPNAGDLQQAVRQSGQFREAQLALPAVGGSGAPDLKSALLSFKSLLQQLGARPEVSRPAGQPAAPSRHSAPQGQAPQSASGYWAGAAPQNLKALLKETDAALARLRLTQLSNTGLTRDSAPQAAAKPMDLVLELPLAIGQETAVMQMQIGRDGAGNQTGDESEPAWRLRFALDLTATGPLEAAISLRGGGTYASLWVDRKDTFDSLNAVRETMEAAFADAGLDLQELRLIRGLPPKTAAYYGAMVDRQS